MENREQKADRLKIESGKKIHANDCATSVAPAEEPGPCDCFVCVCDHCKKKYNPEKSTAPYFAVNAVCSKECFDAE